MLVGIGTEDDRPAVSLAHTEDDLFSFGPSLVEFLLAVLVFLQAADPSFVDFDFAFEFLEVGVHSLSEPVHHEPGRGGRDT